MSLLKLIAGGFFYVVPDEQKLKEYKPFFKKYSYLSALRTAILFFAIYIIPILIPLLISIHFNIAILLDKNYLSQIDLDGIPKINLKIYFLYVFLGPLVENFIWGKTLSALKFNIKKLIYVIAIVSGLLHLEKGIFVGIMMIFFFFFLQDMFLGAFKKNKNGFLIALFCHASYNFMIVSFVAIIEYLIH